MSKIIICYHPADSQAITNRIYDHLCNTFGDAAVILGAKALLRAGDDYMVAIPNQIQAAQALVVVIGKNWADGDWLNDQNDMDRIAIAAALNSQVRVVPVLVNGALPASRDLPSDLESLARRVGLTMSDAAFRQDAPKLVDSVMPSASPPPIPQPPLQQPIPQPPAPVGRVQPQAPPPSPIYGQPPPPAPQPRTGQAGPSTQTFSLDPETVRLIVTGFAAIAGALMIIATVAFNLIGIDNGGSATPLEIIRADYGAEFSSADARTIDYVLLLIPIGGIALMAIAGAVYARRIKTEQALLSISGTAAILFCVPFLWRFLNTQQIKGDLQDAGYLSQDIDQILDSYSRFYSMAEFIWIPVGIIAIAMGGWWFLRTQPQLRLAAHPKMSGVPGQAHQPPQPASKVIQQQQSGGMGGVPQRSTVKPRLRPFYRQPIVGIMGILVLVVVIVLGGLVVASEINNNAGDGSESDSDSTDLSHTHYGRNEDWTPVIQTFNGVEMVLVPAGCFMMGSTNEQIDYAISVSDRPRNHFVDEQPAREQCFDEAFWIDRFEVTNAQFATFGGQAGHEGTSNGGNHPRDSITWFEARDFCGLRDARLTTEAEWEYAARGPDGLLYPWGDEFVAENVVFGIGSGEGGLQRAAVGSKSGGISWVGAYDLSGNVQEWTSSIYEAYPYNASDGRETNSDTNSDRVIRGGSILGAGDMPSAFRVHGSPDITEFILGFRCARSYN